MKSFSPEGCGHFEQKDDKYVSKHLASLDAHMYMYTLLIMQKNMFSNVYFNLVWKSVTSIGWSFKNCASKDYIITLNQRWVKSKESIFFSPLILPSRLQENFNSLKLNKNQYMWKPEASLWTFTEITVKSEMDIQHHKSPSAPFPGCGNRGFSFN